MRTDWLDTFLEIIINVDDEPWQITGMTVEYIEENKTYGLHTAKGTI